MVLLKRVVNCSELGNFSLVLQLGTCWQKDLNCGSKNPTFASFQKLAGVSLSSQQKCLFFDFTIYLHYCVVSPFFIICFYL